MLKRKSFGRAVREGELLPPWHYGFAYYEPLQDFAVFVPMPFNWLIRYGRLLRWQWDNLRGAGNYYHLLTNDALQAIQKRHYERGRNDERQFQASLDEDAKRHIGRIMEIS